VDAARPAQRPRLSRGTFLAGPPDERRLCGRIDRDDPSLARLLSRCAVGPRLPRPSRGPRSSAVSSHGRSSDGRTRPGSRTELLRLLRLGGYAAEVIEEMWNDRGVVPTAATGRARTYSRRRAIPAAGGAPSRCRSRSPDRGSRLVATWLVESRGSRARGSLSASTSRSSSVPRDQHRAWANDIGARPLGARREPRSGAGDHAIAGAS
jgi:hypothetical protein